MTISVNIIACNEEVRLRWCIENIRPFVDEVVVVVQQSDDRTLAVARELADVVLEHPRYGFCEASRPAAVEASTSDWILALDADEMLTPYARDHLKEWMRMGADFYYLRRRTIVGGRELEDKSHGRLFRKGKASIPTEIHTCYTPLGSAWAITLRQEVMIDHLKTDDEQHLDNLRYREIMGDEAYLRASIKP